MKIAIIGAGNMGRAIACGLAKGSIIKASEITCIDLSKAPLQRIRAANPDIVLKCDNFVAVRTAGIIIIAVKPWIVGQIIDKIRPVVNPAKQIIISVAAGVDFDTLKKYFKGGVDNGAAIPAIFRVIPNTAVEIRSSMTFISSCKASQKQTDLVLRIFRELGNVMLVEERLMDAGTALASCGIAFALRYIRAAVEGGVELGFHPGEAQAIVAQTVKGAAELLLGSKSNPEIEIDKVTTPGGITIKGLNEMELSGFTAAVIRGLKASK